MKILITGGCGCLGSNLANFYLNKDCMVYVIDSLYRSGSQHNLSWLKSHNSKNYLKFFNFDIKHFESLKDFFKINAPFDFICHVAGQVAMTSSLKNPIRDFETNAMGTINILECMRLFSPKALIAFSSTNKVYGDLEWINFNENETRYYSDQFPNGFDESLPLDFSTPYGCSKGSADQYVRDWARVFGLNTVVFRHSSIYGARQFSTLDQGWIGWFCSKAIEQKRCITDGKTIEPFTISGSGKQVRDVLHVDDLVNLYHSSYLNKKKLNGEIFNIGGGMENSLSLLELLNFLSEELSVERLQFEKITKRNSDQDFFVSKNDKAKKYFAWTPKVSYKEGIKIMLEWANFSL